MLTVRLLHDELHNVGGGGGGEECGDGSNYAMKKNPPVLWFTSPLYASDCVSCSGQAIIEVYYRGFVMIHSLFSYSCPVLS